ncbi:hypothetical protein PINS_up000461 [Pythium insidiosum]|nr:hypothetical protein PINS_up000461 [Pythium insidiosum]
MIGSMLERCVEVRWFWLAMLGFRVANALFVRTTFNPDEYWQSAEVAHRMVFGYGHLYVGNQPTSLVSSCNSVITEQAAFADRTWEWQEDARLRGFAHPAIFVLLYKLLAVIVRSIV